MNRLIAGLLVAAALCVSSILLDAAPAGACSCAPFDDAAALARSDAVFIGEVTGYEAPPPADISSSTDPAVWTFAVSRVFKGEVSETQRVVSEVSGASCGLEMPHRGEFLVFTEPRGSSLSPAPGQGELYAGLCGGSRALDDGALDPALATGHAPTAEASPLPAAVEATVEPVDESSGSPVLPIAGVVVIGAAIGLGLVLLRRRRNARGATP